MIECRQSRGDRKIKGSGLASSIAHTISKGNELSLLFFLRLLLPWVFGRLNSLKLKRPSGFSLTHTSSPAAIKSREVFIAVLE